MTHQSPAVRVHCRSARPDFRLIVAYLWAEDHDVDSDGDAENPADRNWTQLYLCDRSTPTVHLEIGPTAHEPLVLEITASKPELAIRAAQFLARETGGTVTRWDHIIPINELMRLVGADFDVESANARADSSKYRAASPENPYPSSP